MRLCAIVSALLLLCTPLCAAQWGEEYWQYFIWSQWKSGCFKAYANADLRYDFNEKRLYRYRITECLALQATKQIDLEAHYSFIYDRPIGAPHFRNVSRLELEINPHFELCRDVEVDIRNRIEFIKTQGDGKIGSVFRQRSMLAWQLKDWGRIKAFRCWDEIFVNLNVNRFTQNRFTPIDVAVELNEKLTLDLFLTVRNFESARKWYQTIVFGTRLNF